MVFTVFAIDDQQTFRISVESALEKYEDRVVTRGFENGRLAMEHIRQHGLPNLIVNDVNYSMIGYDGLRFLKELKSEFPQSVHVPIFLYTSSKVSEEAIQKAYPNVTVVAKPNLSVAMLREAVDAQLLRLSAAAQSSNELRNSGDARKGPDLAPG